MFDHEGTLPFYFHEYVPSLTQFLAMAASPANVFYGCYLGREDAERVDLVGLVGGTALARTHSGGRFDAGMCFSKQAQSMDSGMALEFAELALDDAFEAEDLKLICMYGATPKPNVAALRFMRRLGFREYGTCPLLCNWQGEAVDAVMSALTRDDWYGRSRKAELIEVHANGRS